jgi:NAD(P)-dependent dehydrogenase (short-subunit alcohol dehydrogenase family)
VEQDSRTCVVTGAAAGLGLAIAEQLCAVGDTVYLLDRDVARGPAAARQAAAHGGSAEFVTVDVANESHVEEFAARLRDVGITVDILVNNAGTALREGDVVAITRKNWDLAIAVNLTSVYLMCHHLVPLMAGGASIINVSTAGALRAVPGTDAYLAAKGGVIALTKAMAVSLAERGIRSNVICPGAVETEEVKSRAGDPRVQLMRNRLGPPLGRGLGQPSEVASTVLFLCSKGAAYINGAVIPIEGGAAT